MRPVLSTSGTALHWSSAKRFNTSINVVSCVQQRTGCVMSESCIQPSSEMGRFNTASAKLGCACKTERR